METSPRTVGLAAESENMKARRQAKVPLTAAQQDLVTRYAAQWSPIAVFRSKFACFYWAALNYGLEHEDIEQLLWLAVMKAAKSYDPEHRGKGGMPASFATYALFKMKGVVSRCVADARIDRRVLPDGVRLLRGDAKRKDDESGGWELLTVNTPGAAHEAGRKELVAIVSRVLQQLPERLRRIVELRWGLAGERSMSLQEIGDMYGLCKERIRQLERNAMERIRIPLALATGTYVEGVTPQPE